MDALIATLGVLFALFLVLAAAVEAILEMFRGTLERLGITWLKGKTSLDDEPPRISWRLFGLSQATTVAA